MIYPDILSIIYYPYTIHIPLLSQPLHIGNIGIYRNLPLIFPTETCGTSWYVGVFSWHNRCWAKRRGAPDPPEVVGSLRFGGICGKIYGKSEEIDGTSKEI
jgi:hypothetical protein